MTFFCHLQQFHAILPFLLSFHIPRPMSGSLMLNGEFIPSKQYTPTDECEFIAKVYRSTVLKTTCETYTPTYELDFVAQLALKTSI